MEHITNILVYSNRCEVLDSHIFNVGDKGFPYLRLKFIYMFGVNTLKGKQLELKYILPDKSYQIEKITVSGKDEVTFPIHYSVFVNGGWTTLKVSILEGTNRIALDDIILKTKKLEVGQKFENKEVKAIVETETNKGTQEIRSAAEEIKSKISQDINKLFEEKIKELDKEKAKRSGLNLRKVDGEYLFSNFPPEINIGPNWKICFFTYEQWQRDFKIYLFKKEDIATYNAGEFEGGIIVNINNGEFTIDGSNISKIKDIWVIE